MFKLTKLMSMLLVLFLAMACSKGNGGEPRSSALGGPGGLGETVVAVGGGTISGTITLDPSLASKLAETDVIYIIARSADMPGPPLAVKQVRNVRFPYQYTLSSADLMMQGGSFLGKVNIVVRLDRDGAAGPPQPGDMEGVYAGNPAMVGDQKVDILINKVF